MSKKLLDLSQFNESMFNDYFKKSPIGFIDIGARGGSHSLVEPLHTHISYLGFEPERDECDALNKNSELKSYWNEFEILPYALSNDHSKRVLNLISSLTNTSLLEPNENFINRYNMHKKWSITGKVDLDTVPLDHVLFDFKLGFKNSGEVIKVDTQGTELEILEGSKKLLTDRTVCVVSEVEFFQVYKDQKLFSDVELYLRSIGFSFYGFHAIHTRSKKSLNKKTHHGKERLFYADAIFFKDPLSNNLKLTERQLSVLLITAILTGYYDFAIELSRSNLLNLALKEQAFVEEMVRELSHVNPIHTNNVLVDLVNKISNDKENTNIHLGKFIDTIGFPDFEDCVI